MSKCKCKVPEPCTYGDEIRCQKCLKRIMAIRKTWAINPKTRVQKNKKAYKRVKKIEDWEE